MVLPPHPNSRYRSQRLGTEVSSAISAGVMAGDIFVTKSSPSEYEREAKMFTQGQAERKDTLGNAVFKLGRVLINTSQCPLRCESDRNAALPRNDAKGQSRTRETAASSKHFF